MKQPEKPTRSALAVVYATVFLDLLGFGLILPLLPYFAVTYGATGVWLGVLMTAYSAAQFLGAPLIGRLSDRFGRRPLLLLALFGSAASMTLAGFATSLEGLLAARLLAGFFGGSIAAAQAFIADVTTREERSKYMGLLGAAIGLGFVFGPALGAALSHYGFAAAAFTAAGITAANAIFALWKLPESRRHDGNRPGFSLATLVSGARRPRTRVVLVATFLAMLGFVAMETTYPLLAAHLYGLDAKGLGLAFTLIGIVMVLVQGGMIGRLAPKIGEAVLARIGTVVLAFALAFVPFAPTLAGSLALLAVLAVGQGFASPMLATLLSKSAGKDDQGGTLGLGQSLGAAARAVGPLLAGLLYDRHEAAPYFAAAALALVASLLIGTLANRPDAATDGTAHAEPQHR
jgi:DHA1 family tetracycline resistance protein-like MFS transporter